MTAPCRACRDGAPEDCQHLGLCSPTCCPTVTPDDEEEDGDDE
jgi:hypothetical protein